MSSFIVRSRLDGSRTALLEGLVTDPQGQWAIFAGAGISRASGIPLANTLTARILQLLQASSIQHQLITDSHIPFELFIETLRERVSIDSLLDVFDAAVPTAYHHFFAQLLSTDQVQTVATTNYDTLLEKALEARGMRRGRDFVVYATERELKSINWRAPERRIVKLHGCINDRASILVTLARIAARSFGVTVMDPVRHLFSQGPHRHLLVVGYSCSDHFDISPAIQANADRLCDVVWLQHQEDFGRRILAAPLSAEPERNPFRRSNRGVRIYAHAERILRSLWSRSGFQVPRHYWKSSPVDNSAWIPKLERWGRVCGLTSGANSKHLIGRLLIRGTRYHAARRAFTQSLRLAQRDDGRMLSIQTHLNLGICCYRVRRFTEALEWQWRAHRGARSCGDFKVQGQALGNIGNVHYYANRLSLAFRFQNRCLRLARAHRLLPLTANTLGNIGIILEERKRFSYARRRHRAAMRLAHSIGDPIGVARHSSNIALCYQRDGRQSRALYWFRRAEELGRLTGQDDITGRCLLGKGKSLIARGRLEDAKEALEDAIVVLSRTSFAQGLIEANDKLGDLRFVENPATGRRLWRAALRLAVAARAGKKELERLRNKVRPDVAVPSRE